MKTYDNLRRNSARLSLLIEKRRKILENVADEIEKDLKTLPQGRLRITTSRGKRRFYQRTDAHDRNGKYIKKKENEIVDKLAQREYLENLLPSVQEELNVIGKSCLIAEEQALDKMALSHRLLAAPVYLSDEDFVREWLSEKYEGLPFDENDDSQYITASGIRVRSKTEVIVADRLDKFGVPFKYECPVKLGNKIIYPDFVCLNVRLRRIIIFEHFGMMGNEDYLIAALKKIDMYEKNGYKLGINFIFTMESSGKALDIGHVEDMINHYLI